MKKVVDWRLVLTGFLAVFCFLATNGTARASLTDGLVLHLSFNEGSGTTAYDSSGYGNNGTLQSGVTWTTGISGSAVNFDGNGGMVPVPTSTGFDLINDSFTVSVWFKTTNTVHGNPLFGQNMSTDYAPFIIMVGTEDSKPGRIDATSSRAGSWNTTPSNRYDDGQWHNAVFAVADNAGSWTYQQLYVDGVLRSNTTANASIAAWPTMHLIGGNGTTSFLGAIDEVSIYDRQLTPTEVMDLYNAGSAAPVPIPATAWLFGSCLAGLGYLRRRIFSA